jgi:hypothetical protein
MKMPTLQATIQDPTNDVTYRVFAYRPVTREEALFGIATANRQRTKKPKRGSVVDIITTFGSEDAPRF